MNAIFHAMNLSAVSGSDGVRSWHTFRSEVSVILSEVDYLDRKSSANDDKLRNV